jgi:hypothetical protein
VQELNSSPGMVADYCNQGDCPSSCHSTAVKAEIARARSAGEQLQLTRETLECAADRETMHGMLGWMREMLTTIVKLVAVADHAGLGQICASRALCKSNRI